MRGRLTQAWGKLRPTDGPAGEIEWHPLVDHCADVAACVEALLAQPTVAARLGLDAQDPVATARLAALAFLHDLGKANWGFQNKQYRQSDGGYSREIAGHVREIVPLFRCDRLFARLGTVLPLEVLDGWGRGAAVSDLLAASVSHHGTPCDPFAPDPENEHRMQRLWTPTPEGYDPFVTLAELGSALPRWFPQAFQPGAQPLPSEPAFAHSFAGLVMLADWLGSDTAFFPYSREGDGERMPIARCQATRALRAVGIDVVSKRRFVSACHRRFSDLFPKIAEANPMQVAAGQLDTGRLVVLEAETGSGKTEAALWRFKQLFEVGAVDGLYFALPTRIAATQIHARVHTAVGQMFGDGDRPAVVLAVPGYVHVDEVEGHILPGFDVLWPDHPDEAEAHKRWAAENPKRFLAAQISVGTIDQALFSNLLVRHAHLRSTALLRHLLVVDEVHASDVYMTNLLASVLTVHVGAGGHALLMSATLGAAARTTLLLGRRATVPAPADAVDVPYPSLSWADGSSVVPRALGRVGHGKCVAMQTTAEIDDSDAIARRALGAARAGAKVLVVRNTVRGAVAAQQALEAVVAAVGADAADQRLLFRCNRVSTLHHGRFAREDRVLLDRAVEARIGRDRPQGGGIVVGTQTLEQSLDIDADLLITDLCPIDVLLQRLGRLHRHVRPDRPAAFAEARCIVLTLGDRDLSPLMRRGRHGLGPSHQFRGVYPDLCVVEATWRLLDANPRFVVPSMNRMLVEGATHPHVLEALAEDLGSAWKQHRNDVLGRASADRSIAAHTTIDRDTPFPHLHFPGADEQVRTRLGADSRLIDFAADGGTLPTGPFGEVVRILTLPDHLCRGIAANGAVAVGEQRADGFTFAFGDKGFAYDRHGVAPVAP